MCRVEKRRKGPHLQPAPPPIPNPPHLGAGGRGQRENPHTEEAWVCTLPPALASRLRRRLAKWKECGGEEDRAGGRARGALRRLSAGEESTAP